MDIKSRFQDAVYESQNKDLINLAEEPCHKGYVPALVETLSTSLDASFILKEFLKDTNQGSYIVDTILSYENDQDAFEAVLGAFGQRLAKEASGESDLVPLEQMAFFLSRDNVRDSILGYEGRRQYNVAYMVADATWTKPNSVRAVAAALGDLEVMMLIYDRSDSDLNLVLDTVAEYIVEVVSLTGDHRYGVALGRAFQNVPNDKLSDALDEVSTYTTYTNPTIDEFESIVRDIVERF